jgi:hypothetical protein
MSSARLERLRMSRGNKRSSLVERRLANGRVSESLDERALSSASTPVHNMPGGVGKSYNNAVGRSSMARGSVVPAENDLASLLPRRYTGGMPSSSPVNGRPPRLSGARTPTRDENEAPNNGPLLVQTQYPASHSTVVSGSICDPLSLRAVSLRGQRTPRGSASQHPLQPLAVYHHASQSPEPRIPTPNPHTALVISLVTFITRPP